MHAIDWAWRTLKTRVRTYSQDGAALLVILLLLILSVLLLLGQHLVGLPLRGIPDQQLVSVSIHPAAVHVEHCVCVSYI